MSRCWLWALVSVCCLHPYCWHTSSAQRRTFSSAHRGSRAVPPTDPRRDNANPRPLQQLLLLSQPYRDRLSFSFSTSRYMAADQDFLLDNNSMFMDSLRWDTTWGLEWTGLAWMDHHGQKTLVRNQQVLPVEKMFIFVCFSLFNVKKKKKEFCLLCHGIVPKHEH